MAVSAVNTSIDVGDAVRRAQDKLSQLLGRTPPGLRLEEVDYDRARGEWLITLGYLEEEVDPDSQPKVGVLTVIPYNKRGYERVYKIFRLSAATGEFRSMKIRQA